ncbi:flavin reductase family protein [Acidovorax sp. Be4]|uniref:Flavin reductase family protein n=1 Tax=Acidovorax bellezanensis TaxID=2976702 RepID=A0ABT2PQ08_9BURK|nr:flavin reductase family protein [Acidovorax sp. Be4]MCT9812550.1 flavin reductase family protein [Acidovorax sp. Be4]
MRFHLSNSGTLSLREPMDFKRLDVLIDPQPPEAVEQAIRRIGRRESDTHIRLAPSVLRFVCAHAGEEAWETGFAQMLDYAQRHGWVDEQGHVRAHISHGDPEEVVSVDAFKTALRALPAGICAVSTGQGEGVAGMIVSSLTAVSAEPPMIGFFAHRQSSFTAPLLESGRFVANVLGEGHDAVMSQFLQAPQGLARFSDERWRHEDRQSPVLSDALASMECDVVWTQTLGTHHLVVGKVRRSHNSPSSPVVHFNAATHRIAA